MNLTYPPNLIVSATHASYHVPYFLTPLLSKDMKRNSYRLLKNFSDFGTSYLVPEKLPDDQKAICTFSRALGDPNRSLAAPDLFRETDFNNNALWKLRLPNALKDNLIRYFYSNYHSELEIKITQSREKHKNVILFDLHDTGNMLLGPHAAGDSRRDENFPEINIGNLEYESASMRTTSIFASELEFQLGIKPVINHPYKGGYVTRNYSSTKGVEAIQVEFGRYLYVDEKTQQVNKKRARHIMQRLAAAMANTAIALKK